MLDVIYKDVGDLEKAYIIPLSDFHIGDSLFCEEKLRGYINWIRQNPAYVVINGDLINVNLKNSVGNVYKEILSPQAQIDYALEILKPIKDRIIAFVTGNHEERISGDVGVDVSKVIATALGLEDFYREDASYLDVRIGKDKHGRRIAYTFYILHGWATGRKGGAPLNALEELRQVVKADCYIASHTHKQGAIVEMFWDYDTRTKKIVEVKQTFVSSGSFQGYGGYAMRKGRTIAKLGSPRIRLDGRRKDLHVSV